MLDLTQPLPPPPSNIKEKPGHDFSLDYFSINTGSTKFDVLLPESMLIWKLKPDSVSGISLTPHTTQHNTT